MSTLCHLRPSRLARNATYDRLKADIRRAPTGATGAVCVVGIGVAQGDNDCAVGVTGLVVVGDLVSALSVCRGCSPDHCNGLSLSIIVGINSDTVG